MSCISALEGFYVSGKYVAKELTIMFCINNFALAHKMSCISALEGFYVSGKYVAKELTIMFDYS